MATQYANGRIVTDGLILSLDASDQNSYTSGSTTWRDLAGSNNGTLTNGPTFSSAGNASSIVFDGVDDYVELLPTYNTITTSGTVEIAIKFNGTNVYKHIWVFDKTDVPEVRLSTDQGTGNFGFQVYDNGSYRFIQYPITPIMYNNTWIFVQAVWGNNDYRIYLNGSLVSNQQSGGVITNTGSATTSRLGNYPRAGGSQFNGSIGNFKIYNRALTSQEIQQNYNAQKRRFGL